MSSISVQDNWTVYIIETDDDLLYTGISTDPQRRLQEHQRGSRGARFFAGRSPRAIVYLEEGYSRSAALRREYEIKSMTRQKKLKLIAADSSNTT
jgi:putative endonuclease